jgi:hypothetical protein
MLKAVRVHKEISRRCTQNIGELAARFTERGITLSAHRIYAADLVGYASETGYPGPCEMLSEPDYREEDRRHLFCNGREKLLNGNSCPKKAQSES